jgi:hypothetical protein
MEKIGLGENEASGSAEMGLFWVNCYHSSHFGCLKGDAILTPLTKTPAENKNPRRGTYRPPAEDCLRGTRD